MGNQQFKVFKQKIEQFPRQYEKENMVYDY